VDLLGVLVLTVVYSVAACGVLSIVYAVCRTEKQAAALTWLVIMGMSALGGSMTPIEIFPESVQRFSRFTLNYWAVEGYKDLLFSKEPVTSVMREVGILLLFGIVTVAVGGQLLVQKYRRALP
jgi:ABC-2 type transport system permease protein